MCDRLSGISETIDRKAAKIQSFLEQGRGEEAIAALLSEIDPLVGVFRQAPRIIPIGTQMLLAGDLQKALGYFNNVLEANESPDRAWYGRALTYRLLGEDAQAQADLTQAIAIAEGRRQQRNTSPYGPAWLYRMFRQEITWVHVIDLPLYHLALGNMQQAEQMYREALPQAHLAVLELAAERLQDFGTLFPDNPQVHTLYTLLQERLQQSDVPNPTDPETRQFAKIRAAFDPEHSIDGAVTRQEARIQSLFEQGQAEEAIWELDQILVVLRQPPRLVATGTQLLQAGDPQEALAYFTQMIEGNDTSDWAFYGRALAHRLLGEEAQAQADLTQAIAIAETYKQGCHFDYAGPVARLYEKYRQEIIWAHTIDLPLYHLALGHAQQAEQMVREALAQAPPTLLPVAAGRLQDFAALFPDNAQAQALNGLLQEHIPHG
jgi:tetratricopeptide (TPR) repeat protein